MSRPPVWTKERIVKELRANAARNDGYATAPQDPNLYAATVRLFDDWATACEAAGVKHGYKPAEHGTNARYARGCHCDLCVEAHRRYAREYNQDHKIWRKAVKDRKKLREGNISPIWLDRPWIDARDRTWRVGLDYLTERDSMRIADELSKIEEGVVTGPAYSEAEPLDLDLPDETFVGLATMTREQVATRYAAAVKVVSGRSNGSKPVHWSGATDCPDLARYNANGLDLGKVSNSSWNVTCGHCLTEILALLDTDV